MKVSLISAVMAACLVSACSTHEKKDETKQSPTDTVSMEGPAKSFPEQSGAMPETSGKPDTTEEISTEKKPESSSAQTIGTPDTTGTNIRTAGNKATTSMEEGIKKPVDQMHDGIKQDDDKMKKGIEKLKAKAKSN